MHLVTKDNYHSEVNYISKSGLDQIRKSPAHYYYKYLDPNRPDIDEDRTRDLLIGDVFHMLLMEPHLFFHKYIVLPKKIDRRTREGKELWFKYQVAGKGKKVLNKDIYDLAKWMRDSVHRHPIAKKLFSNGKAERIFTFNEPETGVACKIRPDWITPDNIIVDLKSAIDASCKLINPDSDQPITENIYKGFPKSVFNYRYNVQDAFYSDGFFHATGIKPKAFVFVAVEKEPPFQVGLFYLSPEDKAFAREAYLEDLRTYKKCKSSNNWPGYPTKIVQISSP